MGTDTGSKSWFLVMNNPEEHGYNYEPQEICDRITREWCSNYDNRVCACTYCISAEGLKHLHVVVEDSKTFRFSKVKKSFPFAHIEPTKGLKKEAEDYINKKGKYEEKGEIILAKSQIGDIRGSQGKRKDLDVIRDMIDEGESPRSIFEADINFRKYERIVKAEYYAKRDRETPFIREVKTFYHVGEPGSGKSYVAQKLIDKWGEDNVYFISNTESGFMDEYNGEGVLFIDEFRGMKYSQLLSMLDKYKSTFPARYQNIKGLWFEVHITSVIPLEKIYSKMVTNYQEYDVLQQLLRRMEKIIFHWKDSSGYHEYAQNAEEYIDYSYLKYQAKMNREIIPIRKPLEGFVDAPEDIQLELGL